MTSFPNTPQKTGLCFRRLHVQPSGSSPQKYIHGYPKISQDIPRYSSILRSVDIFQGYSTGRMHMFCEFFIFLNFLRKFSICSFIFEKIWIFLNFSEKLSQLFLKIHQDLRVTSEVDSELPPTLRKNRLELRLCDLLVVVTPYMSNKNTLCVDHFLNFFEKILFF